jgi:DNA-binding MarR family transcriptional regulator
MMMMANKIAGEMDSAAMPVAPRVAVELMKICRMLTRDGRSLSKSGRRRIGPTQGRILAFLLDRSHDPTTLTSLAEGADLSPATTSEAVRGLGLRGFVRKVRSRDDARVVFLSLSAPGRRMAEQAAAGSHHLCAAIERLTSTEPELFLRTLKHIQQAVASGSER